MEDLENRLFTKYGLYYDYNFHPDPDWYREVILLGTGLDGISEVVLSHQTNIVKLRASSTLILLSYFTELGEALAQEATDKVRAFSRVELVK